MHVYRYISENSTCTNVWLFSKLHVDTCIWWKEICTMQLCLAFVVKIGILCKLTLRMCPRRKWLPRSFQPRRQGKMPLEKVPVWPHRWMWSLMDIGSRVRNTNADLRQLRLVVPQGEAGPVEGRRVRWISGASCQETMDSACGTHG